MRFMRAEFLVDLIGTLPIELVVFLLNDTGEETEHFCKLQFNRLIRVWKVNLTFIITVAEV